MKIYSFSPKILGEGEYFSEKVREMCKSCKRYSMKATCPPHVESVQYYESLMPQYDVGRVFHIVVDANDNHADYLSRKTSLMLHKVVSEVRNELFEKGHYLMIAFGGGSCKLCESGCAFPCSKPSEALMPLEATGLDVVKFMKIFSINIEFPVKDKIHRVGMILYD